MSLICPSGSAFLFLLQCRTSSKCGLSLWAGCLHPLVFVGAERDAITHGVIRAHMCNTLECWGSLWVPFSPPLPHERVQTLHNSPWSRHYSNEPTQAIYKGSYRNISDGKYSSMWMDICQLLWRPFFSIYGLIFKYVFFYQQNIMGVVVFG